MTTESLHVLDEAECYLLLRSRTLGRVGVHLADQLVFRAGPGTKLSVAVLEARVVFEVDNASPGWSVLVRGHAHELRDPSALVHAESLLGHDWPAGDRQHYVRVTSEQVTGRRLAGPA